jgi:hypothetical protein
MRFPIKSMVFLSYDQFYNYNYKNVAYKVDIDVQKNQENDYFLKCERVFSDQGKLNPIMLFGGKSFLNHKLQLQKHNLKN